MWLNRSHPSGAGVFRQEQEQENEERQLCPACTALRAVLIAICASAVFSATSRRNPSRLSIESNTPRFFPSTPWFWSRDRIRVEFLFSARDAPSSPPLRAMAKP